MATFRTGFLAEEWYDFLKEEVEPKFPGTTFHKYVPDEAGAMADLPAHVAELIAIEMDDKVVFKYKLQGVKMDTSSVKWSLQKYIKAVHNKSMVERYWTRDEPYATIQDQEYNLSH